MNKFQKLLNDAIISINTYKLNINAKSFDPSKVRFFELDLRIAHLHLKSIYDKYRADNDKENLKAEIRNFLSVRWSLIIDTDASYQCHIGEPIHPLNQCCIDLAKLIANPNEPIIKILMPTLEIDYYHVIRKSLKQLTEDENGNLNLNNIVITEKYIIPVIECLELVRSGFSKHEDIRWFHLFKMDGDKAALSPDQFSCSSRFQSYESYLDSLNYIPLSAEELAQLSLVITHRRNCYLNLQLYTFIFPGFESDGYTVVNVDLDRHLFYKSTNDFGINNDTKRFNASEMPSRKPIDPTFRKSVETYYNEFTRLSAEAQSEISNISHNGIRFKTYLLRLKGEFSILTEEEQQEYSLEKNKLTTEDIGETLQEYTKALVSFHGWNSFTLDLSKIRETANTIITVLKEDIDSPSDRYSFKHNWIDATLKFKLECYRLFMEPREKQKDIKIKCLTTLKLLLKSPPESPDSDIIHHCKRIIHENLMSSDIDVNQHIDFPGNPTRRDKPIHFAIRYGFSDLILRLIKKVGMSNIPTDDFSSALHIAIENNKAILIKTIVDEAHALGCDQDLIRIVNFRNKDGLTVSELTSKSNSNEIVTSLIPYIDYKNIKVSTFPNVWIYHLQSGNMKSKFTSPQSNEVLVLHEAIASSLINPACHDVINTYLRCQALTLDEMDSGHNTPIHLAASARLGWLVRILIDKNVDFRNPNLEGKTPLYYSVKNKDFFSIKKLLKMGASNADSLDSEHNPFNLAVAENCFDIIRLFLQYDTTLKSTELNPCLGLVQKSNFKDMVDRIHVLLKQCPDNDVLIDSQSRSFSLK